MQANKYQQAAITYLIYGVLYLSGAWYAAATGISERGFASSSAIGWFVVGGLVVIIFPLLIWKEFKWFTRILAGLLIVRVVGLIYTMFDGSQTTIAMPAGTEIPMIYGTVIFLAVTVITCAMLIRAGWDVTILRVRKPG